MSTRKSVLQWSRLVLVGTIVFMGAALLLTVWITYRGVDDASEALVRGQAAVLQANLRGEFRALQEPATEEGIQAIFESYSDEGLRYIAVVRRRGIIAEAGARESDAPELGQIIRSLQRGEPSKYRKRVRLLLRAPRARGPGRRRPNGPPGPAPIYIEFEATEAHSLLASSTASLTVGAIASILLLLMAGFLARWFVRQDRNRQQEETDRRLKSLGQMSAVLAHEIRNPLTSLKGNAQILQTLIAKENTPDSKTLGKVKRVVGEATRLEALIEDLLNFARSGELHKSDTDPGALLKGCADAIASGITVDLSAAPKTWSLDANRMQQVLSNLLRNASQASENVESSVRVEGEALVFVVRDHGEGFDEGAIEGIFEPFHTKKVHGTGLGLAVAKRLIDLHGGTIIASNADGGGAHFKVEIPPG